MKSGNLNFLEPSRPLQVCNGIALPLPRQTIHVNKLPNLGLRGIIKGRRRRLWESTIMRTYEKNKKYSAVRPLMKWSEKRIVTGLHWADKYASREFHAISYSLVFHVCMLQNEATVLKQMTDVLSHLLAANYSVSSITYRDDSCATRTVGDNRHWIGKQNKLTNNTQNTTCPAHLTNSTQLQQWRSHHNASDVISYVTITCTIRYTRPSQKGVGFILGC